MDAARADTGAAVAVDDLMWRNRRVLAKRLHWPDGVLVTCEWLDGRHPGWSVFWRDECTAPGLVHPAGYLA